MEKLDQEWRTRLEDLANQNKQLYKLATDKFTGQCLRIVDELISAGEAFQHF